MTNSRVRGIVLMVMAVAVFAVMDVALKSLVQFYPPLQTTSLRGWCSMPFLIGMTWHGGGFAQLLKVRFSLHLLRGFLGITMLTSFIFAVSQMSLSDAYAVFFVAPLLITALSVPLLKEKVDKARWIAIAVGLVGVLIMLRPQGQDLVSLGALAALLSALMYAISAITVRVLGRTDSTVSMTFWFVFLLSIFSLLLALPNWQPLQWSAHWHWFLILGICGAVGQHLITEAFRCAPASVVAPFEYTALMWGVLFDYTLWNTLPTPISLLGALVLIGSGVYLLRKEQGFH